MGLVKEFKDLALKGNIIELAIREQNRFFPSFYCFYAKNWESPGMVNFLSCIRVKGFKIFL